MVESFMVECFENEAERRECRRADGAEGTEGAVSARP